MQANEVNISWDDVQKSILIIKESHQNLNDENVRKLLLEKVEGYKPSKISLMKIVNWY